MNNKPRVLQVGIREDVQFGKNVTVIMPSNLYGCKLGDDCFVGPFVEIQAETVIGDRTRVQSHAFICSRVTIGTDCFIGHGVKFINDTFSEIGRPAYVEKDLWKEVVLGNHVTVGTGAVLLPVRICDYTIIGAGSVVTKEIKESGIYVGNPARYLKPLPQGR